jgi:hypothetical protein
MSNKPIEGESAFPHGPIEVYDEARQRWCSIDARRGMTLRQWFVGKALQGLCANPDLTQNKIESIGQLSIDQADAVMALLYPTEASEPESEPDKPETLQAVDPPPDHRQLKVGELKRPSDLVRLLDGTFTAIDGYGEDGKLVQEGEIRFRRNKFAKGDQVVFMPSASASPDLNDVWEVVGWFTRSGFYCVSRQSGGEVVSKTANAEELAPIDAECPF